MSALVDNSQIVTRTNQTTTVGVVMDLSDIDVISVSVSYAPVGGGTATIALYESVDGTNFIAVSGLTVAVSGNGTTIWHINPVFSRYYKLLYTATSGGVTFSASINARNNSTISNADVVVPVTITAS